MPISVGHLALLTAPDTQSRIELWLGPERGALDEATIVPGWLPTTGAGWADQSADVSLSAGITLAHDGRGATIAFTVLDESRLVWRDDLAVALVSRHWDGAAWTARTLDGWGYLDGSGRQVLGQGLDQVGERVATYHGYWERLEVPPHRIGRRDLATSASVEASTPPLASVLAEAGLEYISQDDNEPEKAIDGDPDTVYVGDIIADPTVPALGDTADPRILRAYAGRTTRVIGAGNEPLWIEVFAGKNLTAWGTDWVSPPAMYGGSTATIRNDAQLQTTVVTYGDGSKGLRVNLKQQGGNPNAEGYISWTVGGTFPDRPFRVSFDLVTSDAPSVGKLLHFWATDSSPAGGNRADINPIVIPATAGSFAVDLPSTGNYGGVRFNLKALKNQLNGAAIVFDIKNLRISVGYNDEKNAGSARLFLSYDDGAGTLRTQRLAFDLTGPNLVIPADGSTIITDDIATFRAKFDPGNRLVLQMKNLQPAWFFGPGVGKLALRYGNDPNRLQFNPAGMTTIETIDFTTNGLSWQPYEAVSRQGPIGTGSLAVEDHPHVGPLPGDYGGGYLWLDLGAYQPTRLALPMTSGQAFVVVEDGDLLAPGMEVVIGTERVLLGAREGNAFVATRAQGGTVAAAHAEGDSVTPRLGGATQTGPRWDVLTVRRKPGTPPIRSGVILASNLVSPGDPSTGGALWERHPDWTMIARFDNAARADVLDFRSPGGVPIQARHVLVGDVLMHRHGGVAQRLKINEVSIPEYVPGAGQEGGFAGHGAGDRALVAAHLLTQHGGLPASKLVIAAHPAPIADLPIAGASLSRLLGNLEDDAGLRVWLDPYNTVTISPHPSNPEYDAREPYLILDLALILGPPGGSWRARGAVAQVRGTFTEAGSGRVHRIAYPDVPGTLGAIAEVRGTVRSWAEGRDRVEREYRARNARRVPEARTIGPAPWVRPWLRVVDDMAGLDAGGQWSGVNCAITGYRVAYTEGPTGGAVCETTLTLMEIVL